MFRVEKGIEVSPTACIWLWNIMQQEQGIEFRVERRNKGEYKGQLVLGYAVLDIYNNTYVFDDKTIFFNGSPRVVLEYLISIAISAVYKMRSTTGDRKAASAYEKLLADWMHAVNTEGDFMIKKVYRDWCIELADTYAVGRARPSLLYSDRSVFPPMPGTLFRAELSGYVNDYRNKQSQK